MFPGLKMSCPPKTVVFPTLRISGALVAVALACACAPQGVPRDDLHAPTFLAAPAAFDRNLRDGRVLDRQRDYRTAIASFERALAENPGDDEVLYFLARSSLRAGEPAAALHWLRRLADIGSDLVPAPEDFPALVEHSEFRALTQRIAARAARFRRGTEAFRILDPGLLVEGIAYDPVERAFYAGSGKRGKIVKISDGRPAEDFIGPRPEIDSIGGLRVDARRRRLWAVSGTDPRMDGYVANEPERNALIEFDLETHAMLGLYPLTVPGRHVLNDVEIDARGRPFSTDTADGQIYTLADDGQTLVPMFASPPYQGPNGIAADDSGTQLFVADHTAVHRIDIATRTTHRLAQPRGSALGGLDGLYFVRTPDGPRLVGIQGQGYGRVVSAALNPALDAVTRTEILESAHPLFDGPTTGAIVGSWIYIVANSQLWYPREPRETIILKVPIR